MTRHSLLVSGDVEQLVFSARGDVERHRPGPVWFASDRLDGFGGLEFAHTYDTTGVDTVNELLRRAHALLEQPRGFAGVTRGGPEPVFAAVDPATVLVVVCGLVDGWWSDADAQLVQEVLEADRGPTLRFYLVAGSRFPGRLIDWFDTDPRGSRPAFVVPPESSRD